MRACLTLVAVIASTQVAGAQPADPYGPPAPSKPAPAPARPAPAPPQHAPAPAPPQQAPAPAPAPVPTPAAAPAPAPNAPEDPYAPVNVAPTEDPVLAEQIAQSLVVRAQELYDARVFVDAKQLAVESLVKSPNGASAEHARYLIKLVNQQLGISDAPPPVNLDAQVDKTPLGDTLGTPPVIPPQPEVPGEGDAKTAARVHGGLYAGLIGATIGSFFSKTTPAAGAVPVGIAGGLVGALLAPRALDKLEWNDAQVRTAGSISSWTGLVGGLFADAVQIDGTSARKVLVGASIGSTVGLAAGAGIAHRNKLTRGDVALVDTLAGVGAVGGLTMGMLMQPAEGEAYAVNSILGTVGGMVVGFIAGPQTNTTPRRMIRVAGVAAIGGAAPFLLYAAIADGSTNADERVVGLLSTAGLVGGLVLGFRLTRNIDVDLDVREGERKQPDDAPAAVIGRHSDGRWALGGITIQPLSQQLAQQRGMAVSILGGTF